MKVQTFLIFRLLVLFAICTQVVWALPGQSIKTIKKEWGPDSNFLPAPEPAVQLHKGDPDYVSGGSTYLGSYIYVVWLDSKGLSSSESIDFRSTSCRALKLCLGEMNFEKSDNEPGHELISVVFGETALKDFTKSKLALSIGNSEIGHGFFSRYYIGKIYNYVTSFYNENGRNRAISQFTVAKKNDAIFLRNAKRAQLCSDHKTYVESNCSSH